MALFLCTHISANVDEIILCDRLSSLSELRVRVENDLDCRLDLRPRDMVRQRSEEVIRQVGLPGRGKVVGIDHERWMNS